MRKIVTWGILMIILLAACGLGEVETPGSKQLTASPVVMATPGTGVAESTTESPAATGGQIEAIQILDPGPGSRVSAPLHVAGVADPTFEQNLVVRVLDENGSQLALTPITIQAEAGQRGAFATNLPLAADKEGPVFLQVYATSPRDGGITHLDAVIVNLVAPGSEEIRSIAPAAERIQILAPGVGQAISGGVVVVEGYGWASFEQTLVAVLYDEQGTELASQPIIVQSPDMGQPGPFRAELHYSVTNEQAGRIVVRDPSAAFGGDMHVSSVEVSLRP